MRLVGPPTGQRTDPNPSFLFRTSNSYRIMFPNAAGLAEDNPVQLNGVTVGQVDRTLLSERPVEQNLLSTDPAPARLLDFECQVGISGFLILPGDQGPADAPWFVNR